MFDSEKKGTSSMFSIWDYFYVQIIFDLQCYLYKSLIGKVLTEAF